jgi:hypothetical protein
MGFDDTISDAINGILKGVANYNEYSKEHKKHTINALANLYMIMFESLPILKDDGTEAKMEYAMRKARSEATKEWTKAYSMEHYYSQD